MSRSSPVGLFELAEATRKEKALASPNRVGRPRSYSQNQCDRVFPLQGRIFCAECGHSMTPYYVVHRPNPKQNRVNASYIYYYNLRSTSKAGPQRGWS